MIRYFKTPKLFRRWHPDYIWHIPSENTIYLTFDDGPDPEVTPWVLAELEKYEAKATFFCLGKNIDDHPEVFRRVKSAGHAVGNHTYNHAEGWKTDLDSYLHEVEQCDQSLRTMGCESKLFRPPYGRVRKSQARSMDKQIVMWTHIAYDFDSKLDVGQAITRLKKAKSGSIVVFHDSQKAFKNLKQILPLMLEYYHSSGYKLEVIS